MEKKKGEKLPFSRIDQVGVVVLELPAAATASARAARGLGAHVTSGGHGLPTSIDGVKASSLRLGSVVEGTNGKLYKLQRKGEV